MVQRGDRPARSACAERSFEEIALDRIIEHVRVETDQQEVVELACPPPRGHPERVELRRTVPIEHVVVAEHREQFGALAEHRTERREHGAPECLGVTPRIGMVAEQHQRVVRVGGSELRDRRAGRVELRPRVTDVARERKSRGGRRAVNNVGIPLLRTRPSNA